MPGWILKKYGNKIDEFFLKASSLQTSIEKFREQSVHLIACRALSFSNYHDVRLNAHLTVCHFAL